MLFTEVDRALNEGMTIEFGLAGSDDCVGQALFHQDARIRRVRLLGAGSPRIVAIGYGVTIEAALTEACLNDTLRRLKHPPTVSTLSGGMSNAESDLDQLVWQGFRLRLRRRNKRVFACELRQDDRRVERLVKATSFLDALLKLGQEQFEVSFA